MHIRKLCVHLSLSFTFFFATLGFTKGIEPLKDVEFKSYTGTWYEIARLPNKFQKNLNNTTLTFRIDSEGKMKMISRGYKKSKKEDCTTMKGTVNIPDSKKKGKLEVKLFKFVTLKYNIIDIDKVNFEYALVAGEDKDFLWILSRSPELSKGNYDKMLKSAEAKGFNVSRLEMVKQDFAFAKK